jgi:hypothetical protein
LPVSCLNSPCVGSCVCLEQTVYLVVDSFGRLGIAYRETDIEWTDLETVITDVMSGQFNDPVRVVAFNTLEHWAQNVSRDVALEIQSRCDIDGHDGLETLRDFVRFPYHGHGRIPELISALAVTQKQRVSVSLGACPYMINEGDPRSHTHKGFRFAAECDSSSIRSIRMARYEPDGV